MCCNCEHKNLWKFSIVNFLLLVSSWVCFAGDNLQNFAKENDKIRISSVTLLFIGLTGFRLVPLLKDELEKKGDEKKKDKKKEDESKKDEKKEDEKKKDKKKKDDSLHQTIINMLHLVPEIDGWFTQVTALVALAETYNGSTCAAGYIGSMWTIYVFILIVSVILPVITLVRFSCLEADEKKNWFDLFLYIVMWFMVAFFLIGDNSQPLDCTISGSSSNKTDNAIRIVFIILPLVTYIILVIIWIKDKIESNDSNKTHPESNPPKEH